LYNVFSSGARHGIYAQFITQSDLSNKRRIGLLRGAGTRFGTWFYAMIRVVRLQLPLKDTIHTPQFRELDLNQSARQAILDIENKMFFKAMYTLLRAVFPALRLLRYCDANRPAMDKIIYLAHRTTVALNLSIASLNDEAIFGQFGTDDADLSKEALEVFGEEEEEEEAGDKRFEIYFLL
jgi:hypothetical protein